MSESDFSFFYVTFPDQATANQISRRLLEEKLVACTNIFPAVRSEYWWNGKIQDSQECIAILKSLSRLRSQLQSRLVELHPYETPCFVEINISGGHPAYLQWLKNSLL